MSSLSEASRSMKAPSSLASNSSLSLISRDSKGLWRQHMHDENNSWEPRVQQTEIQGFIENFHCILNINLKI